MKAKLLNKPEVNDSETPHRGRPMVTIKWPKNKRGFTVGKVVEFNRDKVSAQVVRNRLNAMTQNGTATAETLPVPAGKRAHPEYKYTLVS